MSAFVIAGAALAAGLFGYLVWALFHAEDI